MEKGTLGLQEDLAGMLLGSSKHLQDRASLGSGCALAQGWVS